MRRGESYDGDECNRAEYKRDVVFHSYLKYFPAILSAKEGEDHKDRGKEESDQDLIPYSICCVGAGGRHDDE